ncbi:hypothetical protein LC593_29745 [Nostoc sp. CHAB 5844]|nr:hypothetical protein [Nostoc sp. CHAB 5844]
MERQCRGVSAAIFDAGASAVRWGDSTVVRQRGLGGFHHERLPKGSATPVATTLGTPLRVRSSVTVGKAAQRTAHRNALARLEVTVVGFADSHATAAHGFGDSRATVVGFPDSLSGV